MTASGPFEIFLANNPFPITLLSLALEGLSDLQASHEGQNMITSGFSEIILYKWFNSYMFTFQVSSTVFWLFGQSRAEL